MLSLCMESECGLESNLRMPPRLWCGQQPPSPMANESSSGSLLHRDAMGLKKEMIESYLDIGEAGTQALQGYPRETAPFCRASAECYSQGSNSLLSIMRLVQLRRLWWETLENTEKTSFKYLCERTVPFISVGAGEEEAFTPYEDLTLNFQLGRVTLSNDSVVELQEMC